MESHQITPNKRTYALLLKMSNDADVAMDYFEDIKERGIVPDSNLISLILHYAERCSTPDMVTQAYDYFDSCGLAVPRTRDGGDSDVQGGDAQSSKSQHEHEHEHEHAENEKVNTSILLGAAPLKSL
eukprot:GFYU01017508.1.p1 GENE.GFYU01017508.1~~GFYU01017508.1.p1  ORF type:complete len:127 (-),score=17.65 GFYU01017508.1:19-399(-)